MVNNSITRLLDQLLPHRCILCFQRGQQHLDLCLPCQRDLPLLSPPYCQSCAIPLANNTQTQCGSCLKKPPAFNKLITPWLYHHPVDGLIRELKSTNKLSHARVLSQLLGQYLRQSYQSQLPELIVPTPLHWRRLLKRGYNQSELIAQHLSKALSIPIAHPIRRQLHTPKQQGLSAQQRHRNLKKAFQVTRLEAIAGKRIALVDDVVTTGTTAELISQCLLRAGAKEVDVWCLARTPLVQ